MEGWDAGDDILDVVVDREGGGERGTAECAEEQRAATPPAETAASPPSPQVEGATTGDDVRGRPRSTDEHVAPAFAGTEDLRRVTVAFMRQPTCAATAAAARNLTRLRELSRLYAEVSRGIPEGDVTSFLAALTSVSAARTFLTSLCNDHDGDDHGDGDGDDGGGTSGQRAPPLRRCAHLLHTQVDGLLDTIASRMPWSLWECMSMRDATKWQLVQRLLEGVAATAPSLRPAREVAQYLLQTHGSRPVDALVTLMEALEHPPAPPYALHNFITACIARLWLGAEHAARWSDDAPAEANGYASACQAVIDRGLNPGGTAAHGASSEPGALEVLLRSLRDTVMRADAGDHASLATIARCDAAIVDVLQRADLSVLHNVRVVMKQLEVNVAIEGFFRSVALLSRDCRVTHQDVPCLPPSDRTAALDELRRLVFQEAPLKRTGGPCATLASGATVAALIAQFGSASQELELDAGERLATIGTALQLFRALVVHNVDAGEDAVDRHLVLHNTLLSVHAALTGGTVGNLVSPVSDAAKEEGIRALEGALQEVFAAPTLDGGFAEQICEVLLHSEDGFDEDVEGASSDDASGSDSESEGKDTRTRTASSVASDLLQPWAGVRSLTRNVATAVATIASSTAAKLQEDAQRRVSHMRRRNASLPADGGAQHLSEWVTDMTHRMQARCAKLYQLVHADIADRFAAVLVDTALSTCCTGILNATGLYRDPLYVRSTRRRQEVRPSATRTATLLGDLLDCMTCVRTPDRARLFRHAAIAQDLRRVLLAPLEVADAPGTLPSDVVQKLVKLACPPSKRRSAVLDRLAHPGNQEAR